MEIQIQSNETPTSETSGTTGTNNGRGKSDIFYVCPQLTCAGRRDDIQEVERWRLKNDPTRKFSEEALNESVEERSEQERVTDSIEIDTPWDDSTSNTDTIESTTATFLEIDHL